MIRFIDGKNQLNNPNIGKTKKITGTRFASILGLNRWSTAFETWCDITKTRPKPFVKTIFTEAGKIIEPMQIQWLKDNYLVNVLTPEDRYGFDPFKKTHGDFFNGLKGGTLAGGNFDDPYDEILGGMWDGLELDADGKPIAVIECKSTKRSEDWHEQNSAPQYYEYQAILYAYLLGVDKVTFVVTFLDEEDYQGANGFTESDQLKPYLDKMKQNLKITSENTRTFSFLISEKYPNIDKAIQFARDWYNKYVIGKVSPPFDPSNKGDKEILRELTTETIDDPNEQISELAIECDKIDEKIKLLKALNGIDELEKRLKDTKNNLKQLAIEKFGDQDNYVEIKTSSSKYTVSKEIKTSIDVDKLKEDGLYEKYLKEKELLVLRKKENKK